MTATLMIAAFCWGGVAGFLFLRGGESLLGLTFCLQGIFAQRWKKLADKSATGLIRPRLILKLALRLGCYVVLCVFLLMEGDGLMRRELHLVYADLTGGLFALGVSIVVLARLRNVWLRLRVLWRMTHEFDFAERRERTTMLKS